MLAAGDSPETILQEYPTLEPEDIRACLRFAHRSMAGEHVYDRLAVRRGDVFLTAGGIDSRARMP